MATHSSILSWRIPWTEEPDGLQSVGSQKKSDVTEQLTHTVSVQAWTSPPTPSPSALREFDSISLPYGLRMGFFKAPKTILICSQG